MLSCLRSSSKFAGSMKVVETYNTIRAREISSLGALEPNEPNHTSANQNAVIADTVEASSLRCSKLVHFVCLFFNNYLSSYLGVHQYINSC